VRSAFAPTARRRTNSAFQANEEQQYHAILSACARAVASPRSFYDCWTLRFPTLCPRRSLRPADFEARLQGVRAGARQCTTQFFIHSGPALSPAHSNCLCPLPCCPLVDLSPLSFSSSSLLEFAARPLSEVVAALLALACVSAEFGVSRSPPRVMPEVEDVSLDGAAQVQTR